MTLQSCLPLLYPTPMFGLSSGPRIQGGANSLLDAATEKFGVVFTAPKSGNISHIGFRTKLVTTGDDVDVRLETVDGSGDPSGTLKAANANATQTIQDADDDTWFETALTAACAVTIRDDLAAVISAPGGFSGDLEIAYYDRLSLPTYCRHYRYCDHYTGSWVKRAPESFGPIFRIKYDDGSYPLVTGLFTGTTLAEYGYGSGSTPDEIGVYFQLPFPARCLGYWASLESDSACTVKLYDSDGSSVLASHGLGSVIRQSTYEVIYQERWASPQSLAASTWYRLTVVPDGAGTIGLPYLGVSSTAHLEEMGRDTNWQQTSRTDAGAWSQDNTLYPFLGLWLDQLDDGAGTGGGGGSPFHGPF